MSCNNKHTSEERRICYRIYYLKKLVRDNKRRARIYSAELKEQETLLNKYKPKEADKHERKNYRL